MLPSAGGAGRQTVAAGRPEREVAARGMAHQDDRQRPDRGAQQVRDGVDGGGQIGERVRPAAPVAHAPVLDRGHRVSAPGQPDALRGGVSPVVHGPPEATVNHDDQGRGRGGAHDLGDVIAVGPVANLTARQ